MRTLWENYSGSDLELRKYISRISDSILQPMHGSGTQVYGERDLRVGLKYTTSFLSVLQKKVQQILGFGGFRGRIELCTTPLRLLCVPRPPPDCFPAFWGSLGARSEF